MGTKKGDKSDRPHIEFGSVLKRVLKKSRILQSDLTSALDVTNTSTISHYYRGKSLPPKKSLQIILAKIPDQHLRAELADAYNSDVNVVATESIDQTTVQEFFNGVFKLISCGEASLALTTAKKLAEESLDPLWQERLQDTIFRLHLRVGEYGSAAIHAKTLKKIEGQSPIVTATKSYGMLSIALRSAGRRSLPEACKYADKARTLIEVNSFEISKINEHVREYEGIVVREFIKIHLEAVPFQHRGSVAKRHLPEIQRRIAHPTSQNDFLESLELEARLNLEIGNITRAEDILEAMSCEGLEHTWSLEVRCSILKARCFTARKQIEIAAHELSQVYQICSQKKNIHHARVAQQEIGQLATFWLEG